MPRPGRRHCVAAGTRRSQTASLARRQRTLDRARATHQHVLLYGSIPETELRDGRVYAVAEELPGAAGAPSNCLELGESQTALSGCIEHVVWHDDRLEVHGWAFIRGLDLGSEAPAADCRACRTDDRLLPPMRRDPAPEAGSQ